MSSFKYLKTSLLTISLLIPMLSVADSMRTVEYSANLSLSALTQKVYENLPGKLAESNFSQLQQAHADLADAMFSAPAVANLSHFNDAVGSGNGFQEWEGSIDLPLWLSGQKQQQQNLADTLAAQLPAYQQKLKLDASGQVRQLIWAVKLAEVEQEQANTVLKTAQQLEHDVIARVNSGDLAASEALLATNNSLEAQANLLAAQGDLKYKLKHYQQITNEKTLPADYDEKLSSQTDISNQHPYLLMQDQLISTLQAQQDLAQYDGAVNPNLSVGVRRDRGNFGESFTHSLGLGFSMALNNSRYHQPAVAEAAASVTDALVQRQALLRELNTQLIQKQAELTSKQQQLELVSRQNETAEAYYQSQKRAFDLGQINLNDLLRSQTLANATLSHKQRLQVELLQAISQVNQSLGIIL